MKGSSLFFYLFSGLHEVHSRLKYFSLSINLHFESENNEESNDDNEKEDVPLNNHDLYEFLKDILLPLFASQIMKTQIDKKDFSLKLDCRTYQNRTGPLSNPKEFRELLSALKENVSPERLVLKFDMESIKILWNDNGIFNLKIDKYSHEREESLRSTLNLISETLSSGKKLIQIDGLMHEWHGKFFSDLNFSKCEELHIINSFLNNPNFFDVVSKCCDSLKQIEILNPMGQDIYSLLATIFYSTQNIHLVISLISCHYPEEFRLEDCKDIIDAKIRQVQSLELTVENESKKIVKKMGQKKCNIFPYVHEDTEDNYGWLPYHEWDIRHTRKYQTFIKKIEKFRDKIEPLKFVSMGQKRIQMLRNETEHLRCLNKAFELVMASSKAANKKGGVLLLKKVQESLVVHRRRFSHFEEMTPLVDYPRPVLVKKSEIHYMTSRFGQVRFQKDYLFDIAADLEAIALIKFLEARMIEDGTLKPNGALKEGKGLLRFWPKSEFSFDAMKDLIVCKNVYRLFPD